MDKVVFVSGFALPEKSPEVPDGHWWCPRCKTVKLLCEFYARNARPSAYCKLCSNKNSQNHYADNKEKYFAAAKVSKENYLDKMYKFLTLYLKNHPCVDCGNSDIRVLQFDHVARETKVLAVSRMVSNQVSAAKVKAEIEKCVVRCANCHMIRTGEQFNWWRNQEFKTV